MSPAKIDGKSLRIVFRQTDGPGFRLQPLQPKLPETVKTMPAALISITNGSLELTNVVLEGSPNSKAVTPEWLLQATNATIILDGCRLLGSEAEGSKQVGLIRWNTSLPVQGKVNAPALVVRDSYLTVAGCGIRSECGQGSLIFRNSILATRGDVLDLHPIRTDANALQPAVDAENVTFSATGSVVRFEAAAGPDAVTSPVRVFMEKCVFAPPLSFKAGEAARATLLDCVGPVLEQKQLEWWGASNGVARQVVHLVRKDDDQGTPSDERTGLSAWRKAWDKAKSVRFLSGDKGVYLAGELPVRWRELKPASFELHKGSQAATWGDGGKPIGANPKSIEDSSLVKKDDTAKPKVNPGVTNKKNVGF
jgi:serine/threonine-protein kinase